MNRSPNRQPSRPMRLLLPALALWLTFAIIVHTITLDGLWIDEIWSLWAVRPASFAEMLARVSHDYHPPLYFVLLDGWVSLTGDSVLALRMLSALAAILAAAATYTLGRRLFDRPTGVIAVLLLATSGFFRNYAAETRMYSLLLLLSVLCMLAFLRWLERPTVPRSALYGLLLASILATHYHGGWIVVSQGLYLLLFRRDRWLAWVAPLGGAAVSFLPWLSVLRSQIAQRPALLIAAAAPTNWTTVEWVISVITGGLAAALLIPYLLRPDLNRLRRRARSLAFVALWLFGMPAAMLIVNQWGAFFYHPRYLIGILPAGALIVAFGLRAARWKLLAAACLAAFLIIPVARYRQFWPARSQSYEAAFHALADEMAETDALILDLHPDNIVGYYDRHERFGLRERATLDLSGVETDRGALREALDGLPARDPVWLILPANVPRSWFLFAALDRTHHAAYASRAENMLFYRFERGDGPDLAYRFGDLLRYPGDLRPDQPLTFQAGQPICLDLTLTALAPLDGRYSAGVHAVDASGRSLAQWDAGLGTPSAGETVSLTPCLESSEQLPPGEVVLQLTVYDWSTLDRLPVWEDSTGEDVFWGDTLIFAYAAITPDGYALPISFGRPFSPNAAPRSRVQFAPLPPG